jgi:hypothetical protein
MEGAQGALDLALLGVDKRQAREGAAERRADALAAMVEVDRRGLAAGAGELLERAGEERQAGDGEERLGDLLGQRAQPRAQPGGEDERPDDQRKIISGGASGCSFR